MARAETPAADSNAPLRNLFISVRNNNSGHQIDQQQGFSGGIKRDKVLIGTGEPVRLGQEGVTIRHEGLAYQTANTKRTYSSTAEQKIRAVEGYPAFIYTGQSIKLPSQDSDGDPTLVEADALRGFYVTARLAGERVILTISTSNDRFNNDLLNKENLDNEHHRQQKGDRLVIDTEQLATTVSGRIGEWIDLGGVTLGDTNNDSSETKKTTGRSTRIGNIAVKIVALD